MKNLLTGNQMREADAYTIKHQAISPLDLMERAAEAIVKVLKKRYPNKAISISILCGQGNNGGDGLAVSRLLHKAGYENISVYLIKFSNKESIDYQKNLERLAKRKIIPISITEPDELEDLETELIIDAMLGSGLNKELTGKYAKLVGKINRSNKTIIAIDVPTGFPTEGIIPANYNGVKADLAICFQRPKINYFFPESTVAVNEYKVVDIGLDEAFITNQRSNWKLTTRPDIKQIIVPRKNFTFKGTFGHAFIVAGNTNTMGAALLAAKACIRSGSGLTTISLPASGLTALNTLLPEAMALPRSEHLPIGSLEKFTALAIGPGLGVDEKSIMLLNTLLETKKPIVLDADALTMLGQHKYLLDKLPPQTILTPHVKEFDRIFGDHQTWWERVETATRAAVDRNIIIVLKNQYTFVCLPDGVVYINQTGSPAMASGGMGDVLTGLIVGFLAQSYSSADAAKMAVYVHGKAGDELAKISLTVSASQVAGQISKTLMKLAN